jgi:hypothetical protein
MSINRTRGTLYLLARLLGTFGVLFVGTLHAETVQSVRFPVNHCGPIPIGGRCSRYA